MVEAYIYIIINTVNGKTYVGKTNGKDKYYYTGGLLIKRALKKYGKKAFIKKILVKGVFNEKLLNELEKHYIRLLSDPSLKQSYNIVKGGEGSKGLKHTEQTKKLISESSKISSNKKENKERIKSLKYWKGKKRDISVVNAVKKACSKRVSQYTLEGVFIKEWESMSEANRFYNLKSYGVQAAANPNNRKKTAAGFLWRVNS